MNRKRVLVLSSTYPRWQNDAEPGFVHELSKRLAKTFDVTVLGPHAAGAAREEVFDGVRVVRYRYAPVCLETLVNDGGIITNLRLSIWKLILVPSFVLAQALVVWRLLRREHFDVIHAHWLIPQGLIAALLQFFLAQKVPFVVTSHGADLYAIRGRYFDTLKRFVLKRAAASTVVSAAMQEALHSIGAEMAKVSVQPMGVDLSSRFTPDESVSRSKRELLFVGRLVEKKGLRYLIDAMPEILRSFPDAHLTVAGFGPEAEERKAQVRDLQLQGSVRFIGAVQQAQLPELYRRAAVFVAPFVQAASGDREGLGLVAVEAAGCGCPVVISDFPAVHDVFNSRGASFVEPGSPTELAKAITTLLARQSVCDARPETRTALAERFDWNVVAARYTKILQVLVS